MKIISILLLAIISLSLGLEDTTVSSEELKLYNILMEYRVSKGLPKIPLSKSMCYVAQTHCSDLVNNKPDLTEECNAHSWSDKGSWTGCCYTKDHKQAECIWNKPKELTDYPGIGFEIACGSSDPRYSEFVMTADYALKSWQGSIHHNNVIINEDIWTDHEWNAIGVGIKGGFACAWFGKEDDPAGSPIN